MSASEAETDIYLLVDQYGAGKLGIAKSGGARVAGHLRRGWDLVAIWPAQPRSVALQVERRVLHWLRDELGSPAPYGPETCRDGWSETINFFQVSSHRVMGRVALELDALGR